MSVLDFILNVTGLLLWLNWRSSKLLLRARRPAISISSALKSTAPAARFRSWGPLLALLTLLIVRAFFYWDIGMNLNWTASLDLVAIALPWRSDYFPRMLLYSFVSFGLTLALFYASLLLLSAANRGVLDSEPGQKLLRLHLGFLEKLPWIFKLLMPFFFGMAGWLLFFPLLQKLGLVPPVKSKSHLWEQAAVLGAAGWLGWRWMLVVVLALHLLNTYIYLGEHPFWKFITLSARNLLKPLKFLQFRAFDLSALVGLAVVLILAELAPAWLVRCFRSLPL